MDRLWVPLAVVGSSQQCNDLRSSEKWFPKQIFRYIHVHRNGNRKDGEREQRCDHNTFDNQKPILENQTTELKAYE